MYNYIYKFKPKEESKLIKLKNNYNSLIDWKIYHEGLIKRGEILLDFGLLENWPEEFS